MNGHDPTLSIGDSYQDGYSSYHDGPDSPGLLPKRLRLRITPSPPPMVTEVRRPSASSSLHPPNTDPNRASSNRRPKIKASLGDAVLIRFMTDNRDPNIANFEADREFSDRSDDDDDADDADDSFKAEMEPEDSRDCAEPQDNQAAEDTQTEQAEFGTTESKDKAKATTRPTIPSIASLTAFPASPKPLPRERSPIPYSYNNHNLFMDDSDDDQCMTSQPNIPVEPIRLPHDEGRAGITDSVDEAVRNFDMEMSDRPSAAPKPQSTSQQKTSTSHEKPEDMVGLAQMALAQTMSRQNSHNKDPEKKDENKTERADEKEEQKDIKRIEDIITKNNDITDIDTKEPTKSDVKDDDIKDSINVKIFAAPPRPDRTERKPLPGSRLERSSSISSRAQHFRPPPYRQDQQILAAYTSSSAATSPADQSPAYSYTSPSNSGHTPASTTSAVTAPTPASYAPDQPSPAYSSPNATHQHPLSPRRAPTLEHTRPPPLLPSLQKQQPQLNAYGSPPPTNFENLKLSPIATDAHAHANRSGNGASTFDRGMPSANSTTTLPSIARYIESREKLEASPLLPQPSPRHQLPPISVHASPPPTMAKYGSGRDIRDIRDANHSPVSTASRQQTLPPLQRHLRHPLPTSASVHAPPQRSPLPRLSSSSNRPPISVASVRGPSGGGSESMHKRHLEILPAYRKAIHPQLAPLNPDMQAQSQHRQSQAPEPANARTANTPTSASTTSSTPTQVGTYKCDVEGCTAAPFVTQYLLNSHKNVHSNERPHYCPIASCPRSKPGHGFKRKNEMIRHGLVHKSPGYVCPFCPDREHKYPRPDNLLRHVRAHHKDKSKDDPELRDVLAQRPDGPNRGRRRRN